jgi:hypothetical protein
MEQGGSARGTGAGLTEYLWKRSDGMADIHDFFASKIIGRGISRKVCRSSGN